MKVLFRWGRGTAQKHGGFYSGPDRFNPGHVLEHKFEDAMTMDKESWGIRRNIKIDDIYSMDELIGLIASTGKRFGKAFHLRKLQFKKRRDYLLISLFDGQPIFVSYSEL